MTISEKKRLTFTKWLIVILLLVAIIWITWSYCLATFAAIHGQFTVVESLSKTVCTTVISATLGYLLKSFFETYCEKHNELVEKGLDKYHSPILNSSDDSEYTEETFSSVSTEEETEVEDDEVEETDDNIEFSNDDDE